MNTPILLITFNRPQHTQKVLEAIIAAHPQDLYVFQDGARVNNMSDTEKCSEVRLVVESMVGSREITLHTNYSDKNLGCGPGPATAITWFFQNVESGIILEDDCVPHPDFFPYCEELLERYKDDERIGFVGGANYGYKVISDASYSFSSGHHQTWGWASWRRVWNEFDYYLKDIDSKAFNRIIKKYYKSLRQREYWNRIFEVVKKDQIGNSCWDYQFYFSNWKSGRLALCPEVNLVQNVGDGIDATHTSNGSNELLHKNTHAILPLRHPNKIELDCGIDDFLMKNYIISNEYGWVGVCRIPHRLNNRLKKLLGHKGPWIKRKK